MTPEELKSYFAVRFAAYKAQVFRLIKQQGGRVTHATNTLKLEGKTLAEIIAIIRSEVNTHEQNHNYPHGETLADLKGATKESYDARAVLSFPKDAVPISKYPKINVLINNTTLDITLPKSTVVWYGRKIEIPAVILKVSTAAKQYVKVTFSTNAGNRIGVYDIADDDSESEYICVIGSVSLDAGAYTSSMMQVVKIGNAAISTTLRGGGVPANSGSQAAPGTIAPEWFE